MGSSVGSWVGSFVGCTVGSRVGPLVVGWPVGSAVGPSVGVAVGASVRLDGQRSPVHLNDDALEKLTVTTSHGPGLNGIPSIKVVDVEV